MKPIAYHIVPSHPGAHLFTVRCIVHAPDAGGQIFSLPVWTPGSYLIRDFSRHITRVEANCGGRPIAVHKLDKAGWRCEPCSGPLEVTSTVYAYDDSVRAAWLDTTRGFFNGTSVFLLPRGHENAPVRVQIERPAGPAYDNWRVATTLARESAPEWGFGGYAARSYEDLIDHPVEMGVFDILGFEAGGVPHQMVLSGRHRADMRRLGDDLARLCETHVRLFGAPAPMPRYLFLARVVKKGYGGLEHRDSTALICSRDDLPLPGEIKVSRGYRGFLGLCSHEYFHLWNVERIRPRAFLQSDLSREAYTEDLWAYEGVTSYYDELALIRSGLIDISGYLEMISEAATRLWRTPGRLHQSLAASSFDAWTKFYRPDENSPNAIVSYYNKGALVALCLDLRLRLDTGGRITLDDVMRELWRRYGETGEGAPERALESVAQEISGLDLREFFDVMIRGTGDLALAELLAPFGIDAVLRTAPSVTERPGVNLGLRLAGGGSMPQVSHVLEGSPAQAAGLAAGDVLVAIDGLRVEAAEIERMLAAYAPAETVELHAFRRDELMTFRVVLEARPADAWVLRARVDADEAMVERRKAWLGS